MKFSVIIPLYNKAPYIRKALESVCAQTYTDFELIVVDDGSTDGSVLIAERYLNQVKNINYQIIRQSNQGVSNARNNGVAASHGDYVAFLDADDWWKTIYLERMAQLITDYPDAGIYACNYIRYKKGNIVVALNIPTGYHNYAKTYFQTYAMPITSITSIISKRIFNEIGGFNEKLKMGEDFDLWIRIMLQYKMAYYKEPLAIYNQDVQQRWRAIGKLYPPENQFAFNADYLLPFQKSDINIRHVVDMVKIVCIKQYYISKKYHDIAKKELAKIDIKKYEKYDFAAYLWLPLWRLRLTSFLMNVKKMFYN